MICFICGRETCCPIFHSPEVQDAFRPAKAAYENFLEVRDKCGRELFAAVYERKTEQESP